MKKLFKFKHGVGDGTQFTIVVKHLQHYFPDWEIGIECPVGLHSIFDGLCNAYPLRHPFYWREEYEDRQELSWNIPDKTYYMLPATKVTRCLDEVFHVQPKEELYRYTITPSEAVKEKVRQYRDEELHGDTYGLIHYRGNGSGVDKDLTDGQAVVLAEWLIHNNIQPVLLDWDAKSPLAKTIICPDKRHPYLWDKERVGDGATICELITHAQILFGIDSGPEHIAGATETPTVIFWRNHHPMHCYDPADNVTHYLPANARDFLQPPYVQESQDYFHAKYGCDYYTHLDQFIWTWCNGGYKDYGFEVEDESVTAEELPEEKTEDQQLNTDVITSEV